MKTKLHLKRTGFIILISTILSLINGIKAQCQADFIYTLGANGTATLESISTGTTAVFNTGLFLSML